MRRKVGLLIALFVSMLVVETNAQSKYGADSVQCVQNLSVYREFYKQKNIEDAVAPWRWAYINCPKASKNLYIDGAKIFKHLIKRAKGDKVLQASLADSLMSLYDQRIALFGQEAYVLGLKGSDQLRYKKDQLNEAFANLEQSVQALQNKSKATALMSYFQAATKQFEAGTFDKAKVLEVYAEASEYVDYNILNNTKSKKFYEKAAANIEKLFVPFATCEDLVSMFDAKYAETPEDVNLMKRITKVLDKKDCTDAQVYFDAAAKLHESEPTAYSAYSMGNLSLKKNKPAEAVAYYKQALEMAEGDEEKANYYYGLSGAYFKSGSNQTARSNAYKALELRPDWGKPYILIGDIYAAASKSCGEDAFQQAMVFSAAIDKFITAKAKDASVADLANKKIAQYSKYLPSKEDAFFSGAKEGDSHQVGCWINETTKVRIK
jgi:tetratricopeptide (TPR) repeat protein